VGVDEASEDAVHRDEAPSAIWIADEGDPGNSAAAPAGQDLLSISD
jgi:hypothetical protein